VSTVKASIYDFATLSTKDYTGTPDDDEYFTNGEQQISNGHWAIRFFDNHDEDWVTDPIPGGATCTQVMDALYALPNEVVKASTLACVRVEVFEGIENTFSAGNADAIANTNMDGSGRHSYDLVYKLALWEARTPNGEGELSPEIFRGANTGSSDSAPTTSKNNVISGFIYRIKFTGNPGKIRSPEIELYLDGKRPSLVSPGGKVITKVWTDGQQGEDKDHFADHCDGVSVTIKQVTVSSMTTSILTGMTMPEKNLLKKCLGNSDFTDANNQDVYNWDKGTKLYPHIIKLVRTVTTQYDGGYFAVVWYDTAGTKDDQTATEGTFRLLNPFYPPDASATDNYDVYTTRGTLALTSSGAEATFGFGSKYIYTVNVTYDANLGGVQSMDGDISCEVGNNNAGKMAFINHCLNKTDLFTVINWELPSFNPPYINMYTAERLYTGNYQYAVKDRFRANVFSGKTGEMHYMTHFINTDIATNWGASVGNFTANSVDAAVMYNGYGKPVFHVYKFFPAPESTYEYVAPCSNRGLCDGDSGVCQCFPGYTNDNCDTQSSLAV
jgi:hypothetical protein